MRELKNFTPSKQEADVIPEPDQRVGETKPDEDGIKRMIDERSGRSEEELMKELKEEVKKSKSEGRFTSGEVDNFKKTVLPFLNEEQKAKLDEIIKIIT